MKILFILLLCIGVAAQSQNLQGLVDAENEFSRLAKERNTREAFLTFLADSGVTFSPEPFIGKKNWEAQQPDNGWLYWYPVFSGIAASGDFGFNTGPWEFRADKADEKAVAFGQFISVWARQADGNWRVLIDIGITHSPTEVKEAWHTLTNKPSGKKSKAKFNDLLEIEQEFLTAYRVSAAQAYTQSLSTEARVYRHRKQPFITTEAIQKLLAEEPRLFTPMNGAIAASGDLGFVYGIIENADNTKSGYTRIWRKEKEGWKIVIDVVAR